jgi:hypothetical protein
LHAGTNDIHSRKVTAMFLQTARVASVAAIAPATSAAMNHVPCVADGDSNLHRHGISRWNEATNAASI